MSIQKSSNCKLKIGNGEEPEVFTAIGGINFSEFRVRNRIIESSNLKTGAWRELAAEAGTKFLSLTARGLFADSSAEQTLRAKAFANQRANYQIEFGDGNSIAGKFMVSGLSFFGNFGAEQEFEVTLESTGEIVLV